MDRKEGICRLPWGGLAIVLQISSQQTLQAVEFRIWFLLTIELPMSL
jgi:hypothetical protein